MGKMFYSTSADTIRYLSEVLLIWVRPNVVVEWLTLLLGIREVPSSNIGPATDYADDWGFRGFGQSLQANAGIVP
jgi:hypothetical protein